MAQCPTAALFLVRHLAPCTFYYWQKDMKQMLLQFSQLKLKQKENETLVAPYSRSYGRTLISTIAESDDGGVHAVGLLA